jgi:hypothetical protein
MHVLQPAHKLLVGCGSFGPMMLDQTRPLIFSCRGACQRSELGIGLLPFKIRDKILLGGQSK